LKYIVAVLFAAILVISTTQTALAGGPQSWCEGSGGIWNGADGETGTCTFDSSNDYFQQESHCDEDQLWVLTFIDEVLIPTECLDVGSGSQGSEEPYSHNSGQSADEPVGLCTQAGGDWRCSYFTAGTCAVNCYIDPHLPDGAQNALPGGVISTLYVNISPDPGGSYSVCFENPDNESLTIYQYLGGVWVPLATSTNNPICASSSGDGSFYLGYSSTAGTYQDTVTVTLGLKQKAR
jgi:hypothetical protein